MGWNACSNMVTDGATYLITRNLACRYIISLGLTLPKFLPTARLSHYCLPAAGEVYRRFEFACISVIESFLEVGELAAAGDGRWCVGVNSRDGSCRQL